MRTRDVLAFVTAVLLALAVTSDVAAQSGANRDFLDGDDQALTPRLPRPAPDPPTTEVVQWEKPQLVGFTDELLQGNRGVLNMTRACQSKFEGSRVCSAEEIATTWNVPRPPFHGYAWIREGKALEGRDCVGQTSNASDDEGLTIELGPGHGCYGAFVARSCDESLAVACCATQGKLVRPSSPPGSQGAN